MTNTLFLPTTDELLAADAIWEAVRAFMKADEYGYSGRTHELKRTLVRVLEEWFGGDVALRILTHLEEMPFTSDVLTAVGMIRDGSL